MHYAATANATLMTKMTELKTLSLSGLDGFYAKLESAVKTWAGTSTVATGSMTSPVDLSHKATLDMFAGTGVSVMPTNINDAVNIEKRYSDFLSDMSVRFLTQGALKAVFGTPAYDFASDEMKFSLTYTQILTNAKASVPTNAADKSVYWSEIARTLLDYAVDFGTTKAIMEAAINTAAGFYVQINSLGGRSFNGGNGNDKLIGNEFINYMDGGQGADIISGGGGNDIISGDHGSDTIRGGMADDSLDGGEVDNDIYRYVRGDGHDTISETKGALRDAASVRDVVVFDNMARADVSFIATTYQPSGIISPFQSPNSIKIIVNSGGSILLRDQIKPDGDWRMNAVKFSDGTIMTAQQIGNAAAIIGEMATTQCLAQMVMIS